MASSPVFFSGISMSNTPYSKEEVNTACSTAEAIF